MQSARLAPKLQIVYVEIAFIVVGFYFVKGKGKLKIHLTRRIKISVEMKPFDGDTGETLIPEVLSHCQETKLCLLNIQDHKAP